MCLLVIIDTLLCFSVRKLFLFRTPAFFGGGVLPRSWKLNRLRHKIKTESADKRYNDLKVTYRTYWSLLMANRILSQIQKYKVVI